MKKTRKALIIVDMQQDFIDGSLANAAAKNAIPVIENEILNGEYDHIVFTRDTHHNNYTETPEGKALPIVHCLRGTDGWEVDTRLYEAAVERKVASDWACCFSYIDKPTFGTLGLASHLEAEGVFDEVTFVGTCTDICVVSNAIILKTMRPSLKINVFAKGCAGCSAKKHAAALEVMSSCQINII